MSVGFTLARKWHHGQKYGEFEYMFHLSAVNKKVHELFKGFLSDEVLELLSELSWLHDLFEDTECSEHEVREAYAGYKHIDALIEAMNCITKLELETKDQYMQKCMSNTFSLLGKVADSTCNMDKSIQDGDFKRASYYCERVNSLLVFASKLEWDTLDELLG